MSRIGKHYPLLYLQVLKLSLTKAIVITVKGPKGTLTT